MPSGWLSGWLKQGRREKRDSTSRATGSLVSIGSTAGVRIVPTPLPTSISRQRLRSIRTASELVENAYRQHRSHTRPSDIVRIALAPPKHAQWSASGKHYCIRQRYRSPDVGDELWSGMLEDEERNLHAWIRTTLGQDLEPDNELRAVWRKHNRHTIRTGAEAEIEGFFDDVDSSFVLTTWFVTDDSRFIVGSKGGVLV